MTPRTTRSGFTLMELMAVVAILIVLFAVIGPSLNGLLTSGRVESGVTVVSTGVSAARAYSDRDKQFLTEFRDSNGNKVGSSRDNGDGYSGSAIVFTPAGQLRLVENHEHARNSDNEYLEMGAADRNNWVEPIRNGYLEITGREPMTLPEGAAVVGIHRTADDDEATLLPPPFAMRFNQHGNLIAGEIRETTDAPDRRVYYDSDQNGEYAVRGTNLDDRPDTYQPERWMPNSPDYAGNFEPDTDPDSPDRHAETGRRKMAFEALETVIGVIVYDHSAFKDAGYTLADRLDDDADAAREWILENGTPVLINRLTGTVANQR